eukprot:gene25941-biopygen12009
MILVRLQSTTSIGPCGWEASAPRYQATQRYDDATLSPQEGANKEKPSQNPPLLTPAASRQLKEESLT